jgi:tetratricopeptide (TPR) repeat protein
MGKHKKRRDTASHQPALRGSAQPGERRLLGLVLVLGLLALGAYANSFSADLVMDSAVLIKQDPRLRDAAPENISNILHQTYWWPAFESDLYRPLTTLTYLVNYAILNNQDRPAGYHVVNFLLHWANAWLVLLIVRRLAGRLAWAVLAGAVFALHPVNTESVTYIVGRADLLATLSILLAGWCYLRSGDAHGWRKAAWLAGLGLHALWGIFAKESAVMICAFVLLYDWLWRWPALPGKTFTTRLQKAAWQFGAHGYVALAPALLTLWVVRSRLPPAAPVFVQVFVDNPIVGADGWFQAKMTAIKVLGRYLALLVYPGTLSSDYSYNQIPVFGAPGGTWENALAWVSLAAVVLLLWISFRLRRRLPLFTWGVWFFFSMMLPTSNLLMTVGSIMAERFLYLPAIGFCAVAAMALWWIGTALTHFSPSNPIARRWVAGGFCALVLAALGARTAARNADWHDERTLWKSTIAAAPESFKAYKGNANAIWANRIGTGEQEIDTAIAMAERGLAVLDKAPIPLSSQDNTLFQDLGQYYRFKGEFLAKLGQVDEARRFFHKSVDVLLRARAVDGWVNQASRQLSLDRGAAAGEISDVGNFHVYLLLGVAYMDLQDWANCETAARYAMHLQPLDVAGYRMAAIARLNQDKTYDAAVLDVAIVTLQPHRTDVWNELAFCFQRLGLQPVPITRTDANFALDDTQPVARNMINDAAVLLVRQLADARQFEMARVYQQDFVRRLRVPAESFPKLPRE